MCIPGSGGDKTWINPNAQEIMYAAHPEMRPKTAAPQQQQQAPAPTPDAPSAPPPDYASYANNYSTFMKPQIEDQYAKAQDALKLGLAEKGLSGSNLATEYGGQLTDAYNKKLGSLGSDADAYAHSSGADGKNFTPLGDLFGSIIKPVASFNANNSYGGGGSLSNGGSIGAGGPSLANGNTAKVVY
jgi:hypothetical protein